MFEDRRATDVGSLEGRSHEPFAGASRAQRTINATVSCDGVGLHTGRSITIAIEPAAADHGIVFRRGDLGDDAPEIPALWSNVVATNHSTELGNAAGVRVATVEHLMSALAGLGIDNARITVDGPELPIMDGSAAPFVFLLECAGLVDQAAARRVLRIKRAVEVSDAGRSAAVAPAAEFRIEFSIDFESAVIGRQDFAYRVATGDFKSEISRARTFGFLHEVDRMHAAGLAHGASLDNTVVIADGAVMNEEGLRYRNEFVRHKVLDCLGDLYLAGGFIRGVYRGARAGHAMTNRLLRAVFADPANYEWVAAGAEIAHAPARVDRRDLLEVAAA